MNNNSDKEDLVKRSGESDFRRPSRYVVPIIRFNGQTGEFSRININEDGTFDDTPQELSVDNIECVFLKIRRSLRETKKDYAKFTNEHDKWNDPVVLFETTKDGRPMLIDRYKAGEYEKIRGEHQGLKLHVGLYVLIGEEVVKLFVKGSGLGNLFRYFNEDFSLDEHSFEYITKITVKKEEGQLGTYYSLNFARGKKLEKTDLDKVATKIKEVDDAIKAQTSFYETTEYPEEPDREKIPDEAYGQGGDGTVSKDEIPIIDSDE